MKSFVIVLVILCCALSLVLAQDQMERSPIQGPEYSFQNLIEAPWDMQFAYDLEAITGALGNAGAECDGTSLYSTRWATNLLHEVDLNGNLVREFSVTGVSGLRDLAYDGTFFYGGAAATTIYMMDFATTPGTLIGTITSPVPVRYIAYDEGSDAFWVGNWDTPPTLVDRNGTTLATITTGLTAQYGAAYDKYSAGGPYLWIFDQGPLSAGPQMLYQYEIATGTATGFTYDVGADFPTNPGISGGLWISEGVAPGVASIGGIFQGTPDIHFAYELATAGNPMDPNPPSNVTAYSDYNTPTSMLLTWTDPTTLVNGDPITPFTVEIDRDGANIASVASGTETYTDMGLTDGQLYSYDVYAKLISNDSTSSMVNVTWYAGGDPVPAAPDNLQATGGPSDAVLTWNDPTTQADGTPLDDLDHINIYRDGTLVGSALPGDETYTDTPPSSGFYTYTVTAVDNETPPNESEPSNESGTFVGANPDYLVWVHPDVVVGTASAASGDSIFAAILANGKSAYLTNDLFEFGTDLSIFQGVFVVLGIYSNNGILLANSAEALALESYVTGGGGLYLEGGDCFYYDPQFVGGHDINPWFDCIPLGDGSGDVFNLMGLNELSAFTFAYGGENSFMDELSSGGLSSPIWQETASGDIQGLLYDGWGGGAIGVVPSFGGMISSASTMVNTQKRTYDGAANQRPQAGSYKARPKRETNKPFLKRGGYKPELASRIDRSQPLYKITPNGIELLANTQVDLMAAYLDLMERDSLDYSVPEFVDLPLFWYVGVLYDVKALVVNRGSNDQTDVPVRLFIDGVQEGSDVLVSLTSRDTAVVSFPWTPSTADTTNIKIQAFLNGDQEPSNDSVATDVVVSTGAPAMTISPVFFEDTLAAGPTVTETMTVGNLSGQGPLNFEITVEGVQAANAKVDFIAANGQARRAPILDRGKEIPVAEYLSRHDKVQKTITLKSEHPEDQVEPFDQIMPHKSGNGLNKVSGYSPRGEEVFGDNSTVYGPAGLRGRGNHFYCTTATTLIEHRLYLNMTVSSDMQFLVYEGDVQVGNYNLVDVSEIASSATGEGWYSSGPISVPLVAGKYYLIYPQWTQNANYYANLAASPYPVPASFGELQMGVGFNWAPAYTVPPTDPQAVPSTAFGAPTAYYQTIVTGAGTSWLTVNPEMGSIPAGQSMDVDLTLDANGLLGGDYWANVIVNGNDPNNLSDTASVHMYVEAEGNVSFNPDPVVFDTTFVNGTSTISGHVVNSGAGVLNVNNIQSTNSAFSMDTTNFACPALDSFEVNISFNPTSAGSKTGWLLISSDDPNTPVDSVWVQGVAQDAPVANITPNFTNPIQFPAGDSTDVSITIINGAVATGANLVWSASVSEAPATAKMIHPSYHSPMLIPPGADHTEISGGEIFPQPGMSIESPWDMQFAYDLETITGALGNAGAECDGTSLYSTRWATNLLHEVDMNGNLVREFSVTGVSGLRDLAYDGTFFYGGAAANTIYQMDFATTPGTLIGTISSPVPVRFIAYDEGADAFWVGNWDTPPTLVDRNGNTLATITTGLTAQYGAAYDDYSPGGPYLWIFDQGPLSAGPQMLYQYEIATGTATGFTYDVGADFPTNPGISGGLWISEGVAPGVVSIGGLFQGTPDIHFAYELTPATQPWLRLIGATSGSIDPGDQFDLMARLDDTPANSDTAYVVITTNDPNIMVANIMVIRDVVTGIEDLAELPTTFAVSQNYPNPFNPSTTFKYQLPQMSDVMLDIYNVLGQKVRTLINNQVEAGYHSVVWDGRNDSGSQVATGVYIYRFQAGDYMRTMKMLMLK